MSAITTRSEAVNQFPWRTVGLIAVLVLALVGSALLIAGTRRPALPPPFGVAGDGKILYSFDGDIFVRDSPGGAKTGLITGPTIDQTPAFSNDGSKFVFGRHEPGGVDSMWIANADGSALRRLDVPFAISWFEWSPDGTELFVANEDGRSTMAIVPTDGSPSTTLDLGMPAQVPMHRPGHDDHILFKGKDANGDWGWFLVGRDGHDPKRLDLDPGFQSDADYAINRDFYFNGAVWASDGRRLLYYTLEPDPGSPAGPGFRIHLAEIGPAAEVISDRILTSDASHDDEMTPFWLPAEDKILFQIVEGDQHTLAMAPLGTDLGPARDLGVHGADWISAIAAPDGQSVIVGVHGADWISAIAAPDGQSVIVGVPGVAGGKQSMSIVDLTSMKATPIVVEPDVAWQRVAR